MVWLHSIKFKLHQVCRTEDWDIKISSIFKMYVSKSIKTDLNMKYKSTVTCWICLTVKSVFKSFFSPTERFTTELRSDSFSQILLVTAVSQTVGRVSLDGDWQVDAAQFDHRPDDWHILLTSILFFSSFSIASFCSAAFCYFISMYSIINSFYLILLKNIIFYLTPFGLIALFNFSFIVDLFIWLYSSGFSSTVFYFNSTLLFDSAAGSVGLSERARNKKKKNRREARKMKIKWKETKRPTFSSKQKNTFRFSVCVRVCVLQRDFQPSQFREFPSSQQRDGRAREERHQEETERERESRGVGTELWDQWSFSRFTSLCCSFV